MGRIISLKKHIYSSAKSSSLKGVLSQWPTLNDLSSKGFDEILKFMEEHGFKDIINKYYVKYEGFYLIEKILNEYLSQIYSKVFLSTPKQNRVLLETYYLKYQIHNLMVLIRCKMAKLDSFEVYLIGDNHKKEKFLKAYHMSIEEGITYICKKIKFDPQIVLEKYKENLYELENYLYKTYYERISSLTFSYNNRDERDFAKFMNTYIDLINVRSFLKLVSENELKLEFKEIYIEGGSLSLKFFTDLESKKEEEIFENVSKHFGTMHSFEAISSTQSLEQTISHHKTKASKFFSKAQFGSPFHVVKFLFDVERKIAKLRIILKAKYLKMDKDELERLVFE